MKKIGVFALIVVALIAVIKIGSPLLTPAEAGKQDETKAHTSIAITAQDSESRVTIEIENETEQETLPETAEAVPETSAALAESTSAAASAQTSTAAATEPKVYNVTAMDKTMYAIKGVNVRKSYSTDSTILSGLKAGQEVHATGMSDNGWVRISFQGGAAFVYKSYLSTSKADVETTAAKETKPKATKPAVSPTKPATTPTTAAPSPTSPAGPPSGNVTETIPPFPGR